MHVKDGYIQKQCLLVINNTSEMQSMSVLFDEKLTRDIFVQNMDECGRVRNSLLLKFRCKTTAYSKVDTLNKVS